MALQERHAHVHLKYQHWGKKILNSMPAKTTYHIKKERSSEPQETVSKNIRPDMVALKRQLEVDLCEFKNSKQVPGSPRVTQ